MLKLSTPFLLLFFLLSVGGIAQSKSQEELSVISSKLDSMALRMPGLEEESDMSVSGVSPEELLRALAVSHDLNVSVMVRSGDVVTNNFTNVKVKDIFFLLAENYPIDYDFTSNVIVIKKYTPAEEVIHAIRNGQYRVSRDSLSGQFSVNISNDSLQLFARQLTRVSGVNVVYAPELSNKKVSLFIQNASLDAVISQLGFANQIEFSLSEDSVYQLVPATPTNQRNAQPTTHRTSRRSGSVNVVLNPDSTFTLNAQNLQIASILDELFAAAGQEYFYYNEPSGLVSMNVRNRTLEEILERLFTATEFSYKRESGVYYVGSSNLPGLKYTQRVELQYRSVDKLSEFLPSSLTEGLQLVDFPELNSIVASGSYPKIKALSKYITDIDKPVPVIQIEVMIIDFNRNHNVDVGIELGIAEQPVQSGGELFPGVDYTLSAQSINQIISGFNGFGSLNLGAVTPNFYASLRALETNGIIHTRSTPRLATLNGHEATITVGRTEYYVIEQQSLQGVQNPIPLLTRNYQPVSADFNLTIRPFVSGEGQVTLEVNVEQSDFTNRIAPDAPPGQVQRTFTTMIRVQDQEMILIGGLEESRDETTGRGLPWIARIPVLKWLFSSQNEIKEDNRLNIFIKPTIID
ncbi:MAG: hypothetical protein HWD92_03110 [Flavobacteriia bacterium]|nr:hypothetical protein [Flavobacteriia bacterium]